MRVNESSHDLSVVDFGDGDSRATWRGDNQRHTAEPGDGSIRDAARELGSRRRRR